MFETYVRYLFRKGGIIFEVRQLFKNDKTDKEDSQEVEAIHEIIDKNEDKNEDVDEKDNDEENDEETMKIVNLLYWDYKNRKVAG